MPDVEWLSLKDFPELIDLDPAETGDTFEENAAIKARAYGQRAKILTVAEDAGLVVDALNGEPGVRSARWVEGTDQDRYQTLLKKLAGETNRAAHFVAVLCFYDPQSEKLEYFRGEMPGSIALEPKGDNGFGYDPVFIPEGYQETYAQLGKEIKNQISHRKRAFAKFAVWIKSQPKFSRLPLV